MKLLNLSETLKKIADLVIYNHDHEEWFLRPTPSSYEYAWSIVSTALQNLISCPPQASVTTTDGGSIFIQWGTQRHYVRLVVPQNTEHAYIVYKSPENRVISHPDPTADELLGNLQCLIAAQMRDENDSKPRPNPPNLLCVGTKVTIVDYIYEWFNGATGKVIGQSGDARQENFSYQIWFDSPVEWKGYQPPNEPPLFYDFYYIDSKCVKRRNRK